MIKKLAIISLSAVLLGGCNLTDIFQSGNAAKDSQPVIITSTPIPTSSPDSSLEAMPSTSASDEVTSLETDITNTVILDENFSDLE